MFSLGTQNPEALLPEAIAEFEYLPEWAKLPLGEKLSHQLEEITNPYINLRYRLLAPLSLSLAEILMVDGKPATQGFSAS